MRMRTWTEELPTKRPFVISTGSLRRITALYTELEHDGIRGFGEAAPSLRVAGETEQGVQAFWAAVKPAFEERTPADWQGTLGWLHARAFGNPAAKNALDNALLDLVGKAQRKPAHQLLGLKPGRMATSGTVVLDAPEAMAKEAAQHLDAGFRVLKVKLGDPQEDAARVQAVRDAAPDGTLRCDANTAWTEQQGKKLVRVLDKLDVELLEQPVPRGFDAEMKAIARAAELPVLADESCLGLEDTRALASARFADGFVLKLAKCGGLWQAKQMLDVAKKAKLKVMVGCMVESGLGIAAASQLLGRVQFADLDGAWLLARDPWTGADVQRGEVCTPEGHGLGAARRQ
ncbi:MAG: dipeptide epimerase [Halobacteriales archaeon]|nr:dipeptide epimerase [Halobacteriales archaeon]